MARQTVQNYEELARAPQDEDLVIVVLSTGFSYKFSDGHWRFVSSGG